MVGCVYEERMWISKVVIPPDILYDLVCRTSSLDGPALDTYRGHRAQGYRLCEPRSACSILMES